jgi:hypothetical protein
VRISHDFERVKDEVQRMFLETLTFMQFLRLNNEVLGSVQRKVQINVEQGAERAGMGAAINAACCEEIGEDGELVQQPFRGASDSVTLAEDGTTRQWSANFPRPRGEDLGLKVQLRASDPYITVRDIVPGKLVSAWNARNAEFSVCCLASCSYLGKRLQRRLRGHPL